MASTLDPLKDLNHHGLFFEKHAESCRDIERASGLRVHFNQDNALLVHEIFSDMWEANTFHAQETIYFNWSAHLGYLCRQMSFTDVVNLRLKDRSLLNLSQEQKFWATYPNAVCSLALCMPVYIAIHARLKEWPTTALSSVVTAKEHLTVAQVINHTPSKALDFWRLFPSLEDIAPR